ncbi:beta-ketoacyl synthase chain length factor [Sediminicoccus sp. KRV36]|uniref:beta-ketoacyl synthase chain length factor n=1 Tax=Sediminicoccus sp. KRV36 TaxID=3133721 RepID=UPI00200BF9EF|nr:beta-ketoacyl synthase chain length factor [Sediminicoccus rosea]UPY37587.1 beta-ketoacyl synthase chain length factor [Sediminicoccus rosea]
MSRAEPRILHADILGVSLWGPGLEGWAASEAVLTGRAAHAPQDSPPPAPTMLAPNERRRTGAVVRLALHVAQMAVEGAALDPAGLRCVFGSANGDGPVVGSILDALTQAGADRERIVSPTQFHNSVHNAAAGYWSIATRNPLPATCLGCHDSTWAAALLMAMLEVDAGAPVLLCVYDHPMPAPYARLRPVTAPFGVGLVLAPSADQGLARLAVTHAIAPPRGPVAPREMGLAALAAGNPAAQSLRLLEQLARREAGLCDAAYFDGSLGIEVTPA